MIQSIVLQMNGGAGMWGPFGFLMPLVGLLVVGALVYLLWRIFDQSPSEPKTQRNDAIETLRKRYAQGEITEDEFENRARTLREQ